MLMDLENVGFTKIAVEKFGTCDEGAQYRGKTVDQCGMNVQAVFVLPSNPRLLTGHGDVIRISSSVEQVAPLRKSLFVVVEERGDIATDHFRQAGKRDSLPEVRNGEVDEEIGFASSFGAAEDISPAVGQKMPQRAPRRSKGFPQLEVTRKLGGERYPAEPQKD